MPKQVLGSQITAFQRLIVSLEHRRTTPATPPHEKLGNVEMAQ
jgi:hypothetical protein